VESAKRIILAAHQQTLEGQSIHDNRLPSGKEVFEIRGLYITRCHQQSSFDLVSLRRNGSPSGDLNAAQTVGR